ncbi:MAG: restriction endonuclease subunit S [Bacteriovorax sp.]|nr:restriction endonuclease subunit S [Bacteriovorax sp.]
MSKAPSGWTFENLGKYIQILSGYAFKSEFFTNDKKFIPIIRIRDILDGKVETFYHGEYDENFLVKNGDILIGMDGDFHITKWRAGKSLLNQRVCKITTEKTAIDDFTFHFLSKILPEINSLTASTTVKHLSTKDLNEYLGYFPPINEQKKIAEILTAVDRVIKLTSMEIDKLKDLKKGMMQELLTKGIGHTKFKDSPVGKIPESWDVVETEMIYDIQLGKMLSPVAKLGNDQKIYLGNSNVGWDEINLEKSLTMEFNEVERKKFRLKSGDLLVCEGGEIGRAAIWRESLEECYYQKALHRLRAKKDRVIDTQFMQYYLELNFRYRNVFSSLVGTTSISHFTRETFLKLPVTLPSFEEQEKIVDIISKITFSLSNQKLKLEKLINLKKGLMNDLLTGKTRVKA